MMIRQALGPLLRLLRVLVDPPPTRDISDVLCKAKKTTQIGATVNENSYHKEKCVEIVTGKINKDRNLSEEK